MRKLGFFLLFIMTIAMSYGQTILKLKKEGSIYLVPCKINGLDFDLYFDTGASLVSLSLKEAKLLVAAGKLKPEDIIGKTQMTIANGQFVNGTMILIRELKIGDLVLKDIEAVITETQTAPLLLGQSAIKKFGEFTFDYSTQILKINKTTIDESSIYLIPKLSENFKKGLTATEILRFENFYKHRREIINHLTIEVANFNIENYNGENEVKFEFDITNNSEYDFIYSAQLQSTPMRKVDIVVTALTEEGKVYTTTVPFANVDLASHTTTSQLGCELKIRNNKLKGIKIRVQDLNW